MKTAVVYKSRTGFTEKYAEWIAEELSAELMKSDDITIGDLREFDAIAFGGGLYASGIGGIKLVTKNMDVLADKRIAVFAVGATPPRKEDIEQVTSANFSREQLDKIRFFYMRGGFDYGRLSPLYKIIMTLFKMKLNLQKKKNPDARGMLAAYENPTDFTRRKNIDPLIEYLKD